VIYIVLLAGKHTGELQGHVNQRLDTMSETKGYDPRNADKWFQTQPQKYDVFYCLTSYEEPFSPGANAHPVLVLDSRRHESNLGWELHIAPGTSWKEDRSRATVTDILIGEPSPKKADIAEINSVLSKAGLDRPTLFQIGQSYWAPFNSDYFVAPGWRPNQGNRLRAGHLDEKSPYVIGKFESFRKQRPY
jgi:hypothetical protein